MCCLATHARFTPACPSPFCRLLLLPPRCAESKTVLIHFSEDEDEDPTPVPFKAKSKLDGFLSRQGAGGLRLTGGTGANNPIVLDFEKLADGDTYSMVSNGYSGFVKVKKGLIIVEGRLRTDDAILENDVSALSSHAELGCGAPCSRSSPSL